MAVVLYIKTAPKRDILLKRISARIVLSRGKSVCDPVQFYFLPSVKGMQLVLVHIPAEKIAVDTKRQDLVFYLAVNFPDRLIVQMIIVVVGNKKHIDLRDILTGECNLRKAFCAKETDR